MQTLASLQSVRSAFGMGPKERAVYLRRPVPKGRQVVEQSGEEEAGTVAGTNAAALRAWLRQVTMSAVLSVTLVRSLWVSTRTGLALIRQYISVVPEKWCAGLMYIRPLLQRI